MRWFVGLLCLLCLLAPLDSGATDVLPGPTGKNRIEQFQRLKEKARETYLGSLKHHRRDHPERIRLLRLSIAAIRMALTLQPDDIEARVWLGEWLSKQELGRDALVLAVTELRRARSDNRTGSWHFEIATQLGIVLSHLGRFAEAVGEYDRALAALPGEPESAMFPLRHQQASMLSNSAEALMALGHLEAAILRYHRAEQIDTGEAVALHALGLAVAYDRDGQITKSREALARSLAADPGLRLFQSDDVFFVPPGDRSYYEGVIAETLNQRDEALRAFRQFVTDLPKSPYAPRAREHLDALQKMPGILASELLRAQVMVGDPQFAPASDDATRQSKHRLPDEVRQTVLERKIELQRCYALGLRRAPRLGGDLLLALMVDPSGGVLLVQLLDNELSERGSAPAGTMPTPTMELTRCVQAALQRFRFQPAHAGNDENDEFALQLHFEAKAPR